MTEEKINQNGHWQVKVIGKRTYEVFNSNTEEKFTCNNVELKRLKKNIELVL